MFENVNVELLQKVKEHILREPRRFKMSLWGKKYLGEDYLSLPPCGTVACLAGWVKVLAQGATAEDLPPGEDYFNDADQVAQRALGITGVEADRLFFTESWPEKFREEYSLALRRGRPREMALAAAAYIDWVCSHHQKPSPGV